MFVVEVPTTGLMSTDLLGFNQVVPHLLIPILPRFVLCVMQRQRGIEIEVNICFIDATPVQIAAASLEISIVLGHAHVHSTEQGNGRGAGFCLGVSRQVFEFSVVIAA